jgi:lipopolysaccharide/colanic/teichoic acid biosynthesis glycosyltransferase
MASAIDNTKGWEAMHMRMMPRTAVPRARASTMRLTTVGVDVSDASTDRGPHVVRRTPTRYETYVKPVIDRVGGALLLLVTAPLTLAAAVVIRRSMGAPVILRQDRVGKSGAVFTIYKFRTMQPDRRVRDMPGFENDRRQTHKHPNDPRLTPVGRFLRKWSLDELPQFWNVVRGEMSLVGPRPEMPKIVAGYEPWQHARHWVKPGITGLWQISERGDRMMHECTETDLVYLDEISLKTDLQIMVLTPLAALGLRRGY